MPNIVPNIILLSPFVLYSISAKNDHVCYIVLLTRVASKGVIGLYPEPLKNEPNLNGDQLLGISGRYFFLVLNVG